MSEVMEGSEREVLRMLKSHYENRGYSFILYPSASVLPDFLKGYRPDAVALKDPGGVVVELVSDRKSAQQRLQGLAKRFEGNADWRLEVITVPAADVSVPTSTRDEIVAELEHVSDLAAAGEHRAGFVMAWAALEAAARMRLKNGGHSTDRALVPGQIPELLTRYGFIDQATSNRLRALVDARNSVAHGDLKRAVGRQDVDEVLLVVKNLLNQERAGSLASAPRAGR
jgi:hypothetical protein